jgi:hypothetical protein
LRFGFDFGCQGINRLPRAVPRILDAHRPVERDPIPARGLRPEFVRCRGQRAAAHGATEAFGFEADVPGGV